MKKLIYFSILVFSIISISCNSDDDNIPYFKFSEEDEFFLLDNYNNSSKRLVFKNQENEEFSFIFKNFEEYKNRLILHGGGLGPVWGAIDVDHFYDMRKIEFIFEQNQEPRADLRFTFNKYSDTLRGGIRFPLWNIDRYYISSIRIDFNETKIGMTINGVTYNNVIKINSGETSVDYMIGEFPRNVNVLYYDLLNGLIGFDDLDGGEWRLQNN